ncbi:erg28 like protein [Sarocladium implicatum]|nr:erg28 like protein [Sarocladium implicatum]
MSTYSAYGSQYSCMRALGYVSTNSHNIPQARLSLAVRTCTWYLITGGFAKVLTLLEASPCQSALLLQVSSDTPSTAAVSVPGLAMSLLPPATGGYLQYFILYVTASALIHTLVCYTSSPARALVPFQSKQAPEPHPLIAHIYGTKNIYSSLIRVYAAYHLTESAALYDLASWTYAGVLFFYGLEIWVYGTVRPREGFFALLTAGCGLAWTTLQRPYYVG